MGPPPPRTPPGPRKSSPEPLQNLLQRPQSSPGRSKTLLRGPKTPQDAPWTLPRRSKTPPRRDFNGFWEPKWCHVDTKIASRRNLMLKQPESSKLLFFQWNLMIFYDSGIDFRSPNRLKDDKKMTSKMTCINSASFCLENLSQASPKTPQNALRRPRSLL